MTLKTNGFVKYGVFIIIIAVIMGGCKKDSTEVDVKPENNTSKKDGTVTDKPQAESTPLPVENRRDLEKINKVMPGNPEVDKIAAAATEWDSALRANYGKLAPEMKLKDINGKPVSIAALKGKNAIIIKWSTRHQQAKDMLKILAEVQSDIGAKDLTIIAISSEDPAILKPIAESMDIQFPLVGRPHRLVDPYRTIRDTPVCFFIDKTGKIQLIAVKNIPAETVKAILKAM